MPTPSPAFTFSGGSGSLVKLQTTAATSVSATLDSTSGVASVTWSVVGTDETRTLASYTLTPSGSLGETVTLTSGAAGTAVILQCKVNGGINGQTGAVDDSLTARAKFWVPATGTGLEVGCVGEDDESNSTHGWTGIINAAVRNVATGGVTSVSGTAPIVSSGGATPAISITAATTVAAGSMSAADKTKLDDATSAATASKLCLRGSSAEAAFGYLSLGSGTMATTGTIRGSTALNVVGRSSSTDRNIIAFDVANAITIGDSTNITAVEVRGSTDIGIFAGNAFTLTATGGAMSCTSGGAATFGCTAGDLTLGAAANTAKATLSSGTAGNAVSVEANANTDAITCTVNGTASLALSTTAATLGVPTVTWGETVTAPTIKQAARTTDAAPRSITLASQAPYASSMGTNRDAPSVILEVPAPASGGTDGKVSIKINGGTERASIDRYSGVFNLGNSGKTVRIGAHYPGGTAGTGYAAIYFGSNADSPNSGTYGFLGDNADTYLNAPTGVLYFMKAGNVHSTMTISGAAASYTLGASTSLTLTADSAAATIAANKAQALTISIGTQTTNTAPKDLTLTPGQPWASSTSTSRKPGDFILALGEPTNSGTDYSVSKVTRGSGLSEIHDYAQLTTTDATETTVWSYTMSDTTIVHLEVFIESSRTDSGTNSAAYQLRGAFKRRGGGATVIGVVTKESYEDAALTTVTIDASSNDVRVRVASRGAETWVHKCWVRFREVPTS